MIRIQSSVLLAPHTTFRVGGLARYFCEVRSVADLVEIAKFIKKEKVPFFVIGEGSNLLVGDEGFDGVIIKNSLRGIKLKDGDYQKIEIEAGAGEHWDDLVALSVQKKLYGLENLSGIPGTVGASPVQNIGAYGAEVKDTISFVEVFDMKRGEVKVLAPKECKFAYRESIFKQKKYAHFVVTKVGFVLEKQGRVNIGYKDLRERFKDRYSRDVSLEEIRQAVLEIRAAKLPDIRLLGTAGSFFKNPIISKSKYEKILQKWPEMPSFQESDGTVKIPLAWILDKVCGVRGWKNESGRVGTYEKQPLALVNYGGASTEEVVEAAKYIASLVKEKTGIEIEWEVRRVGI